MSIFISIFFGLAIFLMVMILINPNQGMDKRIQTRLKELKEQENKKVSDALNKGIQLLAEDTEYQVQLIGNILEKLSFTNNIKNMLKVADVTIAVDVFIFMSLSLFLPFVLLAFINPKTTIIAMIAGIIAVFIPCMVLNAKIKKKNDQFTQQFPDALGMIASALRAGHSMHAAFQAVVNEMPDPISSVFRTVVDDISLGRDSRLALNNMAEQLPESIDLRFFVTAVLIQREIGGNLAEILDGLSNTIRERFKLLGQLKSQTAQAQLSGVILAIAPVAIGTVLYFMNPGYMQPLFDTLYGQISLGVAFFLAITGFFVIMQVTKIQI